MSSRRSGRGASAEATPVKVANNGKKKNAEKPVITESPVKPNAKTKKTASVPETKPEPRAKRSVTKRKEVEKPDDESAEDDGSVNEAPSTPAKKRSTGKRKVAVKAEAAPTPAYTPIKIKVPRGGIGMTIRIPRSNIEMPAVTVRISKKSVPKSSTLSPVVGAVESAKADVSNQPLSTFVKCTAIDCGKWRLLNSLNGDPQVWTCSMNDDSKFASCESPLQEFNGLAPPDSSTIVVPEAPKEEIPVAPSELKDTSEWTEDEILALTDFVTHNGTNWDKLVDDPILSVHHANVEFAEERWNLQFDLPSGTLKPEGTFTVLKSSGAQHMNNPYVREYLSRYYPHHMNQLRAQYQQYAYHLAQQMVRHPVRAQFSQNRQQQEGRGGIHYNEDGEPYESSSTSESEDDDDSSSIESEEIKYSDSDSDDDYGRKKSKKGKSSKAAKKELEKKFVEYVRPEGARSSGRLSGATRKSYTYDEFAFVDDEASGGSSSEEPSERIDKIFSCRDHADECMVHKHKASDGASRKKIVDCECDQQFYLKSEGVSYIHCEWMTMDSIESRYGRAGIEKAKRYLKKREEVDEENQRLWGGEAFNPDYAEVEKVIASQLMIPPNQTARTGPVEMFLVKWKDLSYGETTWETREDINNETKITNFLENNKIRDESDKEQAVAPTPAMIAEWYKETPIFRNGNSLRDYQLQGLNWLVKNHHLGRNTMLADEMGLGKTIQSLALLYHLSHTLRIHGPFMVIVPLSTIGHWQSELQTWTEMNIVMYHDNNRGKVNRGIIREHEFFYKGTDKVKFHVLLTTYETLLADITELSTIHWQQLIIDEGHRLKNRNARLLSALMQLQGPPKMGNDGKVQRVPPRRVLLTGTPIQNSTEELWTLLNYIAPFEFYSLEMFMSKFGELKESGQVEELQEVIRPYVLRRMKENVEKSIPPKEETIIDIELTTLQKQYYRAIYEKNRTFLAKGCDKSNVPRLINIEMELRKCCNHPWLIKGVEDKEIDMHAANEIYCTKTVEASGKMVLLDKLLPKLKSEGHRVLIFSQMRQVLDILEFYVEYMGYPYERLDGHTHGNDRQRAIDNFSREGSDRFVFLLSTRAGGVGLNLTAADTVIIYDSDWNPQQDVQAQARVHRIGQQKNVSVYRLVTRNTYEAEMFERASKKLGLDQAVLTTMQVDQAEGGMAEADKQDLERLLRRGAYGVLNDDDTAAKEFCDANIDEILARQSRVVVHKGGGEQAGSSLGALQYQKMTFASEGADLDIDINDPHFWEKVLAKEARPGEGTAQDLALMFQAGIECAEGKLHPFELERIAKEEAAKEAAEKEKADKMDETGDADGDFMDIDKDAESEKVVEEAEEDAPIVKKGRGKKAAEDDAEEEDEDEKGTGKKGRPKKSSGSKKVEKPFDDRLNFKTMKGKQSFMEALRVKVHRTISAREAGEHIPDLFDLVELLQRVASMELYFSKKQKDQASIWVQELEARGRRRASRGGGFNADDAFDDEFSGSEIDPDEVMSGDEEKPAASNKGGGRGRKGAAAPRKKAPVKRAPAKPKTPGRKRAKPSTDEDDDRPIVTPKVIKPGKYRVKFVQGGDLQMSMEDVEIEVSASPERSSAKSPVKKKKKVSRKAPSSDEDGTASESDDSR